MKKIIEDVETSISSEQKEIAKKNTKKRNKKLCIFTYIILLFCAEAVVYKLLVKFLSEDFLLKYNSTVKVTLIITFVLAIRSIIKSINKIDPTYHRYEIFDINFSPTYGIIRFCYLNSNKKLVQAQLYESFVFHNLYIEEIDTPEIIVIEYDNDDNKKNITQFICNKDYYNKLKEKFNWKDRTN